MSGDAPRVEVTCNKFEARAPILQILARIVSTSTCDTLTINHAIITHLMR